VTATVIRSVIERVDADLARRVGAGHVAHARATVAALIEGNYGSRAITAPKSMTVASRATAAKGC